jgi:hypothetical protein
MQRMTYEEIKKTYPDEWVLIDDIEVDKFLEIVSGVVVAHSRSRDEIGRVMLENPGNYGIRYTGKIKGVFALNLF